MPEIKTREVAKGTVKAIDKSAVAAEHMKDAYIRTKQKAEPGVYSAESSPDEYATDRISGGTETAARETVHQLDKFGRKSVKTTKENISKVKDHFQQKKADIPKKQAQKQAEKRAGKAVQHTDDTVRHSADTAHRTANNVRYSTNTTRKAVKTFDRGQKTIKQTAKSTGKATAKTAKGTVKTAQKSVKTAERTAKTVIKTTQQAAKTAQKTAQATARAAKTAAQAARATAKAVAAGVKAAVKATIAAFKAIIAATKALIVAIAAGGWVAVVVIIVICLIGLIVGSCFGIFFSNEDSGSGQTMQAVVQEINTDYQTQIDTTKANISYDVLEISGSHAVWSEVLSIYAVKTTTDPNNAQEVATMDDSKKSILKDIFWQMNQISSRTQTKTEEAVIKIAVV